MPARRTASPYPPIAVQLRRRRRIRLTVFSLIALIVGIILLDHLGCFGFRGDDHFRFDRKPAVVTGIVDAITVSIRTDEGREGIVRLIGDDVPTSGIDAKSYTASHLLNVHVLVRLDALQTRDDHGNLLAYLYLNDADVFNVEMVHDGFAYSDRRVSHMLSSPMDGAESDARRRGRGMWKDPKLVKMPAWREQWLKELREHHHAGE